jgi:tetratricopeptide (TPR) repeat protein
MKLNAVGFWRACVCGLVLAGLILPGLLMAQTQTNPPTQQDKKKTDEYDTPYTEEEYAAYEAATKEADPAKRLPLLNKFLKDYPKSTLKDYILAAYKQMFQELYDKKQHALLATVAEGYLANVDPNDMIAITLAAESYRSLNNHEKYLEYGQRVFNNKPTPDYAYSFAKSYEALKNEEKYVQWALKTMDMLPAQAGNIAIHIELLTRLMQINAEKKQLGQAAGYAQKLVPLLETAPKPDSVTAAAWKEYLNKESGRVWSLIGESHFEKERWKETMGAYQKVLKYMPKNDLAYYRIGLCYWKLDDPDLAIENFAIAHVLNGNFTKQSYEYLERLYKALHNNTTVGLNRALDTARKQIKE